MKDWIDRVEKGLIRFVIIGMVIMVVVQGFMSVDPIRLYLSWGERLEGEQLQLPAAVTKTETADPDVEVVVVSPQARMVLEVTHFSSLPRAQILVNGAERAVFNGKRVSVPVQAGDTVEIDSTAYNFPIEFSVAAASANLVFPEKDRKYTANQTVVMVGKVVVK